jgi:hypothetical protein
LPSPNAAGSVSKLQLGRFYNYVGRLLRCDGMFRVIVLEQGTVLHADDLGVPGHAGDAAVDP